MSLRRLDANEVAARTRRRRRRQERRRDTHCARGVLASSDRNRRDVDMTLADSRPRKTVAQAASEDLLPREAYMLTIPGARLAGEEIIHAEAERRSGGIPHREQGCTVRRA